jgi:hypothetical protein
MRKKIVWHKNRPFMLVEPRPWMMNSNLISDALKTGGHLAVEMNEGYLTVIRHWDKPMTGVKHLHYRDSSGTLPLPWDMQVAAVRIKDHLIERRRKYGFIDPVSVELVVDGRVVAEKPVSLDEYDKRGFEGMEKILRNFTSC